MTLQPWKASGLQMFKVLSRTCMQMTWMTSIHSVKAIPSSIAEHYMHTALDIDLDKDDKPVFRGTHVASNDTLATLISFISMVRFPSSSISHNIISIPLKIPPLSLYPLALASTVIFHFTQC